jgi:hypothetical protein
MPYLATPLRARPDSIISYTHFSGNTDHHYSKDWTIAPASPPRYAPKIR